MGRSVGTVTSNYNASIASGIVISQDPEVGMEMPKGSVIHLLVSAGLPPVTTTVWDPGTGSADWSTDASWTNGVAPLTQFQNHKVAFNVEGAKACVLDTPAIVAQLVMGDNGTANGTFLTLADGAGLTAGLDDADLVYRVETCTNLIPGNWMPDGIVPVGTNLSDGAYDEVTNTVPLDTP